MSNLSDTFNSLSCVLFTLQMVKEIGTLVQFLSGDFNGGAAASSSRLRKLVPVVREYAPQLRDFGTVLLARLTEKNLSRGLTWVTEKLRAADRLPSLR
jgi:hypothetical protein